MKLNDGHYLVLALLNVAAWCTLFYLVLGLDRL